MSQSKSMCKSIFRVMDPINYLLYGDIRNYTTPQVIGRAVRRDSHM